MDNIEFEKLLKYAVKHIDDKIDEAKDEIIDLLESGSDEDTEEEEINPFDDVVEDEFYQESAEEDKGDNYEGDRTMEQPDPEDIPPKPNVIDKLKRIGRPKKKAEVKKDDIQK